MAVIRRDWDFASDAGLTYDPTKVEITGGAVQLVSSGLPSDLTFYHSFDSVVDWDADHATGDVVPWLVSGGCNFTTLQKKFGAGSLDCAHNDNRHLEFSYQGLRNTATTGTFEMFVRPNYTGSPGVGRTMLHAHDSGSNNNGLQIFHSTTGGGQLRCSIRNTVGAEVVLLLAAWTPTAGTWYHIEVSYDLAGTCYLFVDGIVVDTKAGAGARNDPDEMQIGTNVTTFDAGNFWLDDLRIYDNQKHTANFTPPTGQLASIPADLTFYAQWNDTINSTYTLPDERGTTNGAPVHDTVNQKFGAACLGANAVGAVSFSAEGNASHLQEIAIGFWVRPDYNSITGLGTTPFLFIGQTNENSMIQLNHIDPTNQINLICASPGGGYSINQNFGVWTPNVGQWYYFELNCRFQPPSTATRLFIDGTQFGPTNTNTVTRDKDDQVHLRVALNRNQTGRYRGKIDDFQVYDTVQHTANFTPPTGPPSGAGYATDSPAVYFDAIQMLAIQQLLATSTEAGATTLRWAVRQRGWQYYFNGNRWDHRLATASSVTQSCTTAEITANIRYLRLLGPAQFVCYFLSDGSGTPQLSHLTVFYVG